MQLKRFSQFINEGTETMESEEVFLLIDDVIYLPYIFEFEVGWAYEKPEPDVGIYGGSYPEDWELTQVDGVYKIEDPEIVAEVKSLMEAPEQASNMGLGDFKIDSLVSSLLEKVEPVELTEAETFEFSKKVVALWKTGELAKFDVLGNLAKVTENFMNELDPPDGGQDDYDDYEPDDDRW